MLFSVWRCMNGDRSGCVDFICEIEAESLPDAEQQVESMELDDGDSRIDIVEEY